MEQTMHSKQERPLLAHAVSKLRPGVFSHPVWVRFSNKAEPIPPETIQDLFEEAEQLQHDNPSDACQVLLICAVFQNYSGQRTRALATTQKALDLAERNGLSQEILWAIWGECSICVQQGNFEQAAVYFGHLQAVLYEQNEWMLADYIDVVMQFFRSSAMAGIEECSNSTDNQYFGGLLNLTLDWLQHWGCSAQSDSDVPFDRNNGYTPLQEIMTRSLPSAEGRQGPWHTLRLMISGELKLHWEKNDSPHIKSRSSFWGSILNSLKVYFSGGKIDDRIVDAVPHIPNPSTSENATGVFLPRISSSEPVNKNQPIEETPIVIPMSVHMLGKFEMSIQDGSIKSPASRNLSLLKYLLLNHKQSTHREALMEIFWPDAAPETARNNLNVAMHGIRRALRTAIDFPVILYRDGAYTISPNIQIWLDVEEFERLVNAGQRLESRNQSAAVPEYEAAISIYQGDFLQENPYEEWTVLTREHLRAAYLDTLDRLSQIYFEGESYAACITVCQHILARDCCREDAHCMLMRCYNHQGQDHMALRQYQACVEALHLELDVAPAPTTTELFQQIRQHRRV
jgi:DNA-binding SARP family transcriptional activator